MSPLHRAGAYHERQYEQLGVLLIRRSHLLVGVMGRRDRTRHGQGWNGRPCCGCGWRGTTARRRFTTVRCSLAPTPISTRRTAGRCCLSSHRANRIWRRRKREVLHPRPKCGRDRADCWDFPIRQRFPLGRPRRIAQHEKIDGSTGVPSNPDGAADGSRNWAMKTSNRSKSSMKGLRNSKDRPPKCSGGRLAFLK